MNDFTIVLTNNRLQTVNANNIVKALRKAAPLGQIISAYAGPVNVLRIDPSFNEGNDVILALGEEIRSNICLVSPTIYTKIIPIKPKVSTIYVSNRQADNVGLIEQAGKAISFAFDTPNEWTGVAVLLGQELRILKEIIAVSRRLFLFEILNKVIFNGGNFVVEHGKRS